jgi:manganese transport protein
VYRKILVTLENGPADEAILKHIESLAKLVGGEVLLVHVADGWAARNLDQLDLAESQEMRQDRAYLEGLRDRFAAIGVPAEAILLRGDPGDEIVKLAEARDVDLIAMGGHGHRLLVDLVLGSTTHKVRHAVSKPVLVVRAPRPETPRGRGAKHSAT